jgi:hypothetical protein
MNVNITGISKNLTKTEIRAIIRWMAAELRIDKYKNPVHIDINFIKNLKKRTGFFGVVSWEDTNYRPREFSMEVDANLSKYRMKTTLIHEMIHVKQFCTGKMQDFLKNYNLKKWCKEIIDTNQIEYENHPWEVEAYKLEEVYYKKWIDKNKKCR